VEQTAPAFNSKLKRDKERGSAVVEFALILPIFLLLVFSLIDFGRYFYVRVSLTNASIEVASAITRGLYLESETALQKTQKINALLDKVAPNAATLAQLESNATLSFPISSACPNASSETTVQISTNFNSISPISNFLNQVSSTTTMRCLR
jgi:Flp pilus assembly protein TadG